MTARKSWSLASASTQKTYSTFSCRPSRLTNGDRQVSAPAGRSAVNAYADRPRAKARSSRRRGMGRSGVGVLLLQGNVPAGGDQRAGNLERGGILHAKAP